MGGPVTASARIVVSIDPSAGDVSKQFNALYVGVSGDIKVDTVGGDTGVVFKNVPVGFFPVVVTKVYQSGTTATQLIGLQW